MSASEHSRVTRALQQQYGIRPERVLSLHGEPWLPADVLIQIARQSGEFSSIEEDYTLFIPELNQVVHYGRVTDPHGRTFRRSGIATLGETLPDGAVRVDEHALAAARALRSALDAAGFDPLKAGSVAPLKDLPGPTENDPESRVRDLARIHILATEAGLIVWDEESRRRVDDLYRAWLAEHWGVTSAAALDETQRKSVIATLLGLRGR